MREVLRPMKALNLPGPAPDRHEGVQNTPEFKEAERLAREFGLLYLSITGIHKLSMVIAEVRAGVREPRRSEIPGVTNWAGVRWGRRRRTKIRRPGPNL